jgi:polyhydroxyalkanoate synthesis repressor PhaR
MAEERLIRKYANRRLYDAQESRHVTLEDLRKLITQGQRLKVIDDKSGEDLTRSILLQIIASQSSSALRSSAPSCSRPSSVSTATPSSGCSSYLEQSIGGLLRQQSLMQAEMAKALETPMAPMAEMARQNMETWAKMQASMLGLQPPTPPRRR